MSVLSFIAGQEMFDKMKDDSYVLSGVAAERGFGYGIVRQVVMMGKGA